MNLLNLIIEIQENFRIKRFDNVCKIFESIDKDIILPNFMYIIKSAAIQLCDNSNYTLDDAKNSLLYVIKIDNNYINGWVDLGFFYFAIEGNNNEAQKCFEKARNLINSLNLDLISGEIKLLIELNKMKEINTIKYYINLQNDLIDNIINSEI